MTDIFWTYLQTTLWLTGFLLVHRLFLRKSTLFGANRAYIVVALIASVLLPFVEVGNPSVDATVVWQIEEVLVYDGVGDSVSVESYTVEDGLVLAYWIGMALAGFYFLTGLVKVIALWVRSERLENGKYVTPGADEVFSWFKITFIPKGVDLSEEVLQHERAHIQLGHSIDNLFAQIYCIVFWFNPGAWYFRRELMLVHEYQADQRAQEYSENWKNYTRRILAFALDTDPVMLGQSFSRRSELGRRVEMMKRSVAKRRYSAIRFASIVLLIPVGWIVQTYATPNSISAAKLDSIPTVQKADVMPKYPGGMGELMGFIASNIEFTDDMKELKMEGKVHIGFTIDFRGRVVDVHVARSLHPAFDEAAVKAVRQMPDWEPGLNDGQNVNVRMILPVKFATE